MNYTLQPNESIIMKSGRITHGGLMIGYTDELVLTNLNIILIEKGVFGNVKNIKYFPINQIKVYNGKPQVILTKQQNGFPKMEVYLLNGQDAFGFESKKEAEKWINNINQLFSGTSEGYDDTESKAIPGVEFVADVLKDTFDTFAGAFGFKSKTKANATQEKIAKKCSSCGSQISGTKGQVIRCQYCDSDQQL